MRTVSSDGQDVYWGLMVISPGSSILVQDKNDHTVYARFTTTALPIDKGLYVEIPVVWQANGTAIGGGQEVLLQSTAITTQIHHTTHEPGGSDALRARRGGRRATGTVPDCAAVGNVARRDQANTFVARRPHDRRGRWRSSAVAPYVNLRDTNQPANARLTHWCRTSYRDGGGWTPLDRARQAGPPRPAGQCPDRADSMRSRGERSLMGVTDICLIARRTSGGGAI